MKVGKFLVFLDSVISTVNHKKARLPRRNVDAWCVSVRNTKRLGRYCVLAQLYKKGIAHLGI